MEKTSDSADLAGRLLIASPGMEDPRFRGSVILVCAHSDEGSMGLIINKPTPEVSLDNLLEQLKIPLGEDRRDIRVHFGGPVETGRGFVLHTTDYEATAATMTVGEDFAMTASLDILQSFADGDGPRQAMLMLGYSGWGPGQLESELVRNGWLVADADRKVVFDSPPAEKWQAALALIGIDPVLLSATGGRA